ncbi:MAG: GAF domain-containing sensor histidine kinase [Nitrospirota bacterium]
MKKRSHKKTYDYYAAIQKISRELTSKFSLDSIYNFIGDTLLSTLALRDIYILSLMPGGNFEEVYRASNGKNKDALDKAEASDHQSKTHKTVNEDSEASRVLKNLHEVVIKGQHKDGSKSLKGIDSFLETFHGEALTPVYVDDKLTLLMILGGKMSGDMFNSEDISLLNTVAHQTAIAIKHARLYQENLNSEKLAAIGMMSATFAHQIRNPLTSLKTCAQLMPERYDDADFRDTFSKIVRDDVKKIEGLINDLLDFSAKEIFSGKDNYDLTAVIDETIDNLQYKHALERQNILIEKKYRGDAIKMTGSVNMLTQAFSNIINNGCQAMGNGGLLIVDINPNGRNVNITIRDTGIGMSHEEINRIFDPFYTTKPLGVGLGLAISKRIIEEHGGRIKVESRLSQGTIFTVSLPLLNSNRYAEESSMVS